MKRTLFLILILIESLHSIGQNVAKFANIEADTIKGKRSTNKLVISSDDVKINSPELSLNNIDSKFLVGNYNDVVTLTPGDATPDVSAGTVFVQGESETTSTTITDLDNPTVGAVYTFIGGSWPLVFNDAGNFNLVSTIYLLEDDVLQLYVVADNDYVQASYVQNSGGGFNYYVSTTGSNANAGTSIATAFRTITKAEATATDGQIVCVLPGTYNAINIDFNENVSWYGYGATVQDSTGLAAAGWLTLTGTDVKKFYGFTFSLGGAGGATYHIILSNATGNNYFEDCSFTNTGTYVYYAGGADNATLHFTDCTLVGGSSGVGWWRGPDLLFSGCTVTNILGVGFKSYYATTTDMTTQKWLNCDLTVAGGNLITQDCSAGFIIENCNIISSGNFTQLIATGSGHNVYWQWLNDTITINNTVSANGILYYASLQQDSVRISGCVFSTDQAKTVIYTTAKNNVNILNNTITSTSTTTTGIAEIVNIAGDAAMEINIIGNTINAYHGASGATPGYNIACGTETTGTYDNAFTGQISSNIVYSAGYFNHAATSGPHGIFIGFSPTLTVKLNRVYGAGLGYIYKDNGTIWTGNDSLNYAADCISANFSVKGVQSVQFDSDTSVFSWKTGIGGFNFGKNGTTEYSINCGIIRSINYYGSGMSVNGWVTVEADSHTGFTADYNTVYGITDNPYYLINGTAYDGWAAIQAAGYEENGSNINPF